MSRPPAPRPRPPGRPRSPAADRAILDATVEILTERGFEGLTVEGVAERAGVGRTTVYRRWPSRAALVHAVTSEIAAGMTSPDTGTLAGDLEAVAWGLATVIGSPPGSRILPGLMTAIGEHPELRESGTQFYEHRRRAIREALARAVARGEVPPRRDAELAIDFVLAPVYYRTLVTGAPVTRPYVRAVVRWIVALLGAPSP